MLGERGNLRNGVVVVKMIPGSRAAYAVVLCSSDRPLLSWPLDEALATVHNSRASQQDILNFHSVNLCGQLLSVRVIEAVSIALKWEPYIGFVYKPALASTATTHVHTYIYDRHRFIFFYWL